MSDKLNKYGYAFQVKVLSALLSDRAFLQQISDLLEPKYFESEANQWIVQTTLDYFKEYNASPTLEVMKVKLNEVEQEVLKQSVIDHLKDAWKYIEATDLEFVKEETLGFCKNQSIKKAILKSVDLLQNEQYDQIKLTIDNAMKAGADRAIGHEYNSQQEIRYAQNVRNVIKTPWDVINDMVEGGFGKGELVVFVAPAGIGKSWGLINVGVHAVKNGLRVAHYTMELNEAYVGIRYDAVLTGTPVQNLKFHQDELKDSLAKLKGELIIKYYPTKSASVSTIKAHMDKLILQGKKPDMVIVDYADLLKSANVSGRQEVRHQLESVYEDLRGLAGEYEVPVYTASQANRSALEDDIIEAGKIAESYSKIMIADFVISLSRKVTDKIAGTGRWHVIKNRFGPDGITLPSKMNMSNGQIHIFEETSVNGKDTKKLMGSEGETLRKTLSQKFKEISSDSMG